MKWDKYHIDILTAHFVQHPDWFDVVVASNLFGDILSDLGPACTGTIGIAPSGNINPEGKFPSLFEPVHGSAPDIAGKGIANPIGQIWSAGLMLNHLGEAEAGAAILQAIETRAAGAEAAHRRSRRQGEHGRVRQGGRWDAGVGDGATRRCVCPVVTLASEASIQRCVSDPTERQLRLRASPRARLRARCDRFASLAIRGWR